MKLTFMYHKILKSFVLNRGFSIHITHDTCKIQDIEMVSDILDHPVYEPKSGALYIFKKY